MKGSERNDLSTPIDDHGGEEKFAVLADIRDMVTINMNTAKEVAHYIDRAKEGRCQDGDTVAIAAVPTL